MSVKRSGDWASGTCCSNQAVTFAASMPFTSSTEGEGTCAGIVARHAPRTARGRPMASGATTIDVTDDTFGTHVMERSSQVPVVVDLWAEWCGPCKTLGPILEKVVAETGGKVVLAKVDVDSNPNVARAFQVQGIPAVYALRDGKVVDAFVGAQPEQKVREFVDALLPSDDEQRLDALVDAGDEASLRAVLEEVPGHERAVVALAELLAQRRHEGDVDEALALLERIPDTPEVRRVAALARAGD